MGFNHIIESLDDGIEIITFNRSKALNALNSALLEELSAALDSIASNDNIRVLVLTGSGDKAFVAGADIKELAGLSALQAKYFAYKGQSVINQIVALPIPVIAAVNGYALGGGMEVALACDFIYVGKQSIDFEIPEPYPRNLPNNSHLFRKALFGLRNSERIILFPATLEPDD